MLAIKMVVNRPYQISAINMPISLYTVYFIFPCTPFTFVYMVSTNLLVDSPRSIMCN